MKTNNPCAIHLHVPIHVKQLLLYIYFGFFMPDVFTMFYHAQAEGGGGGGEGWLGCGYGQADLHVHV